ncbi:MAG TPA: ATP-binding protein [Mycobacteriales bacterium]|nr:ATP-binding protein [Mycobacteriales bacterium]
MAVCWTRERHLSCVETAPEEARRFVSQHLAHSLVGITDLAETLDDSQLLVSELTSNAVKACRHTMTLSVEVHHRWIGLKIYDDGPGLPVPYDAGPRDTRGRGLRIIAALASAWGAHPDPAGGKTVWCHLPLPAHAADHLRCDGPPPGHHAIAPLP